MSDQSNGSQGQLFSDAAVGAPSYDDVDTDRVGYRGPTACAEPAGAAHYGRCTHWPHMSHRCCSPTVSRALERVN